MSVGFFTEEDTNIIRGDESTGIKRKAEVTCNECGLSLSCISPKMKVSGEGKLGILIVGEAPGDTEDKKGIQFIGRSGQLLRKAISELGYDLDRDFWKTNAIRCHPDKNATPTGIQIQACSKQLMKDIIRNNPKVVIPLGKVAMDSLVGNRMTGRLSSCSMTDWAGAQIPDQELKRFICPSWHPSYILRSGKNGEEVDPVLYSQLVNHLRIAINLASSPFYESSYLSECIVIDNLKQALKVLETMSKKEHIAFDYETTGKKPHRDGHRIFSVSISDGLLSYAFPFFDDIKFRKAWARLMTSDSVGKICHNAKYEALWTLARAGYNNTPGVCIQNLIWDTMLGGHSLHNRKRTGLKYYTYIHFGIAGYDDSISSFLEASPKEEELYGANGFNNIQKAPIEELLRYNAMDSLMTYKLWEFQSRRMNREITSGIQFFTKASVSLMKCEDNGIIFNSIEAQEQERKLATKLDKIERKILSLPELKKWDKSNPFRVSATGDLTHLLFDIMEYKCKDEDCTPTGRPKGDIESLEKYNEPIVIKCLEWRKWQKVLNTYLKGFSREAINGIIHPLYNLNIVDTFRSSSSNPNFQNIPKRDGEVAELLRHLLIPRKGHRLGEYDYKAIEVCIIACYNKDPTLISYINDPSSDMHKDMAAELFLKDKEEVTKIERYGAKNGFVFPTFYGSYYRNTASNLWNNAKPETIKHLKSMGIKTISDFTDHVRKVEKHFWEDRFPVGYEWMERTIANFKQKGFMDSYTGFRYQGPLSNNQIINYPIQGSAFHCLLWTLDKVSDELERRNMKSLIIGQIHDAMIPDFLPDEEEELDSIIYTYGTQKIREHWPWIIVPLNIEKSRSAIDGNWSEMETIGLLGGSNEF